MEAGEKFSGCLDLGDDCKGVRGNELGSANSHSAHMETVS